MTQFRFNRVLDGEERSPAVGAVVTVGRRDPQTGAPVETNRFFFTSPQSTVQEFRHKGKTWKSPTRSLSVQFHRWNGPVTDPTTRNTISAVLGDDEPLKVEYAAKRLSERAEGDAAGGGTLEPPPVGSYACQGNGERAFRFAGLRNGEVTTEEVGCGAGCPYKTDADSPCKPRARLLLVPRLPQDWGPEVLCSFATHGLATVSNLRDMVASWERYTAPYSFGVIGMPFTMQVGWQQHQTKPQRIYPVVSFGIAAVPIDELRHRAAIEAEMRHALPPATDEAPPDEP